MPSHRRGRSLSEALTLERSEEGALVVSSIDNSASANQGLREGDEILGATINFDQLSKEEVLQVLKLMEPFNDKIQVLTKNNRSKSVGNLDQCAKSPETMLKDSYSKLYDAKIKKFMRGDFLGEESSVNGEVTANPTVPATSKDNLKHDMGLPRLGVDFGLLKTKTLSTDVNADSQSNNTGELTYDSNLNLPPLCIGSNGTAPIGPQVPRLKVDARSPQLNTPDVQLSGTLPESSNVNTTAGLQLPNTDSPSGDLTMPHLERAEIGLDSNGSFGAPELAMDLKGSDLTTSDMGLNLNGDNITGPSFETSVPKVAIEGANKEFNMPKFKLPDLGLSGPSFSGPEYEVKTPDVGTPDVPSGKLSLKYSKRLKNPDLNVDDPSGYTESPKLRLSGRPLDLDQVMPEVDVSQLDLNGPDIDMPSGKVKVLLKKSKIDLKSRDLDVDAPSGKFTLPKFGVSGKSEAHVETPDLSLNTPKLKGRIHAPDINLPKADLKGPNLAIDTPSADIKGPSGKYKAPKFTMPKFDLPDIQVPGFNGDLVGPDMPLVAPDLKAGLAESSVDLNVPSTDFDIANPSGKLKMPGFGISGAKLNGPEYELKTPDMDVSAPKFEGGIDEGKFTMPKPKIPCLNISGPKRANIDIDASLNRPGLPTGGLDVDLSKPEFDIDAPSLDLKSPRSNLNMPEADIGGMSEKIKMPSFTMPDLRLSGPKVKGLDGELKTSDFDLSAPKFKGAIGSPDMSLPKMDLRKPKLHLSTPDAPNMHIDTPSSKFQMPKFDLAGTLPEGPNLDINTDLKSPVLSLKGQKIKGEFDAPDLDLPNMDLKAPKVDVNAPNVNIGSPKAKLKMPKLKMPKFSLPSLKGPEVNGSFNVPDMDINAPNVNLKGPKADLEIPDVAGPSRKFEMPNLNMPDLGLSGPKLDGPNLDLKAPDLDISSLNLSGGLNAPDINMPKVDLKSPKIDLNTPKLDLDMPSGKLEMPEVHAPDLDVKAPSGKFKFPKFNLSGTLPKGPNLDLNADLKSPDLSLKTPQIKGGIDAPDLDLPSIDLNTPKLDVNTPDVNIGSPKAKFKMPKFKLPKFSLPSLKGPEIDGNLDGPDVDVNVPNVNLKGPKADLEMPDVDISGPSGKFKKPNFNLPGLGLSGPKLDGPNLDLKAPDLDISSPNLSGGINAPDINMPKVAPDMDVKASSGKLKFPNFNLSGTLPKGPNLDLNADLKSPDLSLKAPAPKLDRPNLDLKSPDINLPKVDHRSPKLDLNTRKLNLDMPSGKQEMPELHAPDLDVKAPSGKLKFPKFNLSGTLPKGPNLDLNADLKSPDLKGGIDAPDWDLPNVGLKSPKVDMNTPDVNIGSPKTKLKMPKLKMPKFSLPNLKGPEIDADFDGPDIEISPPNAKLKGSKPGFEMPDVDFGSPSGKLKKPHLKMPDVEFSGPKFDGPDFDFKSSDINAKLPEGPNLNINSNLKTPDLNLKAPKIKGGINAPKLDLPSMDLKAPKLDMNTPDVNIGFPEAKIKKPKIKMPKGPNVDINGDLQGPDLFECLNVPDLSLSGPKAKTPAINLSGPKLKGPDVSMPDLNLPDAMFNGPKTDLKAKHPDLGINGNKGRPEMNFTAPQVNGGIRGPDIDMHVPLENIQGHQTDLDSADRTFNLPSFKVPQFGGPDFNQAGSDVDFGASRRPTNLDFSHPNTKLNMQPPQLRGNITGPNVSAPNMDLSMPKMVMRNPKLHLKNPDLNIDDPSLNFRGPSYKNHRSQKTKVRSSYPLAGAHLGHHIDFSRADLNIDDFTGKDHVLRARGSKVDLQASHDNGHLISNSGVNIGMRDPRHTKGIPPGDVAIYAKPQKSRQPVPNACLPHSSQDSRIRVPDSTDGYYVTVFPTQTQSQKLPNRKYNTLGGPDFYPTNMELEVPGENHLKGSTFFFSNLV